MRFGHTLRHPGQKLRECDYERDAAAVFQARLAPQALCTPTEGSVSGRIPPVRDGHPTAPGGRPGASPLFGIVYAQHVDPRRFFVFVFFHLEENFQ